MKKLLILSALIVTAGLTLLSSKPVVVLETSACASAGMQGINILRDNMSRFMDMDLSGTAPIPEPCPEPPPGYDDCIGAATDDYNDAVDDAISDAVDAMTSAYITAKIEFAIGERFYKHATTEKEKFNACKMMQDAGDKAWDAFIEIQDSFVDDVVDAMGDAEDAMELCCEW